MTLGLSVLSYKQIHFHKQIYEKHSLGQSSKEFPLRCEIYKLLLFVKNINLSSIELTLIS